MNWPTCYALAMSFWLTANLAAAQQGQENLHDAAHPADQMARMQDQVEQLSAAVAHEESALESSRRQIFELRKQVAALQAELSATVQVPADAVKQDHPGDEDFRQLRSEVDKLREQTDVDQSELAVHEQAKVESESKFPLKLTGLILMNSYATSGGVDTNQSPAIAIGGSGATGFSLRQTVLGLDARGPHVFGAKSEADVRIDFFGGLSHSAYGNTGGFARLRTAHAEVAWNQTRAFVEMDRPIINPNSPTSLTAVAQPALAWSGNLWDWVPQVGAEHSLAFTGGSRFKIQAAVADIPDPVTANSDLATASGASLAEKSRWPASEARFAYAHGEETSGLEIGIGGYFSPHSENNEIHFDAWAATIDFRIPITSRLEASGGLYRGLALGGLGGGALKDYAYRRQGDYYSFRPLDDVGGWTQLKAQAGARLQFNAAYGIDNLVAGELRPYLLVGSNPYQNLARNSTMFANVIFSPTAYTLFSFEYRRIDSSPAVGPHSLADVFGATAGYRF